MNFINYTRELKFDDRPDYSFLKKLIKSISDKEKFELDFAFDWAKQKSDNMVNLLVYIYLITSKGRWDNRKWRKQEG